MLALHVILNALACAFAAYTLSILSHTMHEVPCSSFRGDTATFCSAAQEIDPGFVLAVRARHPVHATLALSVLFLFLCTVEFLASLISPMPDANTLQTLQKAKPETNVFFPSVYAPDGIGEMEKQRLRTHIAHRLRTQLQEQMQQQDLLLTRNVTISEIVLAKREKSLMDDLPNGARAMNTLNWNDDEPQDPLHYMISPVGTSSETSSAKEEEQIKPGGRNEDRQIPPRLLEEVVRISSRIEASVGGKTNTAGL
ncbi:uncharacterized protein Tco025E_09513 [Trypanosoma conorhini]|uniref:Transmembrane protein n=1 Tax=Trypanosoma conorhini TaxID=83891 RepID=A0A3R7JXW8_9TRYP|nr:uncharacterized protein Tco025E_09513 [Trypanosoma conorhini]RNE97218.1 hypothetical protein Tco025E_09513 [Trypanosoma conorhini]